MKKLLLCLASSIAVLSMSAQGTVTSSTTNNNNDMLFYASPAMADSQKIVTDAGLIPEVAALGMSYSIPQYIVECLATQADLSQGDANKTKEGRQTRVAVPANAKVTALSLPGRYQGGNSNILVETTWLNNVGTDVTNTPYIDLRYYDFEDVILDAANGFEKLNEPVECQLGAEDASMLFSVPFTRPFIYDGDNLEVAVYLNVKDYDRGNNVMFDFAKTPAQAQNATVYHAYAEGAHLTTTFNFYAGCDLDVAGPAVQAVLDYLDLDENSLPAFQLDFYTNDIRGIVMADDAPAAGKQVVIYSIDDEGNKTMVATVTTDADGAFEVLNLDHTANYCIEVVDETLEDNVLSFGGDDAIDNDLDVVINLSPVTAVEQVTTAKAVTSVAYYNLAGARSAQPFAGINLVETRYSDGTTQITKVIQ